MLDRRLDEVRAWWGAPTRAAAQHRQADPMERRARWRRRELIDLTAGVAELLTADSVINGSAPGRPSNHARNALSTDCWWPTR